MVLQHRAMSHCCINIQNLMVNKKKNPLFVRIRDRKIYLSGEPIFITLQAL